MDSFDFIVIGGGIAGTSIAYELSASSKVLLLEQEDAFAYHTTGRSAATYIELLLDKTIATLSRASKSFLQTPPPGFADFPILNPCGCIMTANRQSRESLRSIFQQSCEQGIKARILNTEEIATLIPIISTDPDAVDSGIYEPTAARIDVDGLLQGYRKGARERGCKLVLRSMVEQIERSKSGWFIRIGAESYQAPVLINASGAWADEIASLAGVAPVGLEPRRRTMITFDAPPGMDITPWPMVGDISNSFYFLPESGQLMGSCADETLSPPCDAQPEEIDIATCVYNIEQHTNVPIKKINHSWAGLRTFAPDRYPLVGFDPAASDFFWFAGLGGFGIQTAPALSKLGAAIALGNHPMQLAMDMEIDLPLIQPNRFR